ncbi:MAG: hypothetical protein KGI66_02975, partial [Patescibacteria group bacterium]|nr:hypothetical protein [Patescibacteria group bacterium]
MTKSTAWFSHAAEKLQHTRDQIDVSMNRRIETSHRGPHGLKTRRYNSALYSALLHEASSLGLRASPPGFRKSS